MPFSSFASLAGTLKSFEITQIGQRFTEARPMVVSDFLRAEMDFMEKCVNYTVSEFAICENLIYPILKEVWKHYPEFQIWSHTPLCVDDALSGTPDYFMARRSPLGTPVVDKPVLLVVEAKKDNFDWGWGQCLAAMLAAQKLSAAPDMVFFGITTTGSLWQFGKLEGARFIQDPRFFDRIGLDQLCGAVNFIFEQCRKQLQTLAGAA